MSIFQGLTWIQTAAAIIGCIGMIFMLISLIGIVRFPDFYTRLHAQGIGDTIGAMLIVIAMMMCAGTGLLSGKIFLIFVIIVLTNPIGTNLMMIAAINRQDYLEYNSLLTSGGISGDGEDGFARDEEDDEGSGEET